MTHSETLGALAAALAAAQGAMGAAGRSAENEHLGSKYADLQSYLAAARPHLAAQGLAVSQGLALDIDAGRVTVTTLLVHCSGEWLESALTLPVGSQKGLSDAQSAGSVITYARRYALAAMVGLASEDDDGAAKPRQRSQEPRGGAAPSGRPDTRPEPSGASTSQREARAEPSVSDAYRETRTPYERLFVALGRLHATKADLDDWLDAENKPQVESLSEEHVVALARALSQRPNPGGKAKGVDRFVAFLGARRTADEERRREEYRRSHPEEP